MTEQRSEAEQASKNIRLLKTLRRLLGMARAHTWAIWLSAVLIVMSGLLQAALPVMMGLTIFAATPRSIGQPAPKAKVTQTAQPTDSNTNSTLPGNAAAKPKKADEIKGLDIGKLSKVDDQVRKYVRFVDWQNPIQAFAFYIILFVIFYLSKCIANGLQLYYSQYLAQNIIFVLRERLHAHLIRLSSTFFESRRTGDLMSRTTSDVNVLQSIVSSDLVEAARAPITISVSLGIMLSLSPSLTLVTFAVGPIVAYAISRSSKKIRALAREVQRRLGQLNTHLQERLSAVRVVQLFTREDYEIQRFHEINSRNLKANLKSVKIGAVLYPGIEFTAFVGMIVALLIAGMQMIHSKFIIADLLVFLVAAQQAGSGFIKIGKIRLSMDQALAAGERVFEILDSESEVKEPVDAVQLPRLNGDIKFDNVSFRYATGEPVLSDINLHIKSGEVVALVGPSGAGKTSLVNLIPRFYDPSQGSISVDGTDIRCASLQSLRSQIGIVPQETFLFAGTILENIAYGRLEATRDEIIAAAQAANADEFICNMPNGYDSVVGEHGVGLSGGQRQRIAIARAILKAPRILILDEPTSSLDIKSEKLVLEALNRLMTDRTSIVIAHRLSTIKNADRILVLSDGRVVEEGSHDQLYGANGTYRHLYEGQFPAPPGAIETDCVQ